MKRAKREEKDQKKVVKKAEQETKQKQKAQKKADREQKKAEKAKQKEQERLQKKKEKAAKKQKEGKEKKTKGDGRSKRANDKEAKRSTKRCLEHEPQVEEDEDTQDLTPVTSNQPESSTADAAPDVGLANSEETGYVSFEPCESSSPRSSPGILSRRFKKLRALKDSFEGIVAVVGEPDDSKQETAGCTDGMGHPFQQEGGHDENMEDAGTSMQTEDPKTKKPSKAKTSRRKQQEKKAEKKGSKKAGKTKLGAKSKQSTKASSETTQKRKRGQPKPVKITEVDEKMKDMVMKVLKECKSSHCCHPTFVKADLPKKSKVSLSTYWTRCAVGVKLQKGSSKKPSQIAYFAQPTTCPYTNLAIAGVYVAWTKIDTDSFELFLQYFAIYVMRGSSLKSCISMFNSGCVYLYILSLSTLDVSLM